MSHSDLVPTPVFFTDANGRLQWVNAAFVSMAGGDKEGWIGQSMNAFVPRMVQIFLQTHLWPMLMRDGMIEEVRLNVLDAAQNRLPVLLNCQRVTRDGVDQYSWVMFVTHQRARYEAELLEARKRAQTLAAEAAKSERFLRAVTDAVPSMIAYWSRDLHCQFANNQYLDWFGRSAQDMQGCSFREALGDELFEQNRTHFSRVLAGQAQEFERSIVKPDGSLGHTLVHYVPDMDPSGQVAGFYAISTDVSERHSREEQVRQMALHDGLTGLPNRRLLMERLRQVLALAVREAKPLALLFLDLDGFKAVNDRLGHHAGDAVLQTVAARLQELVRATDTVARLGGDEFVVLLYNPDGIAAVTLIAQRVIEVINQPIHLQEGVAHIGTSIGVAMNQIRDSSADTLLKHADEAMYAAKRAGKNTFSFMPLA